MTVKPEKLVYIYSVDTSAFYTDEEHEIFNQMMKFYNYRNRLKQYKVNCKKRKQFINNHIYELKNKLKTSFNKNTGIRHLRKDVLKENKVIGLFESVLTRTLGIKEDELSEDIIVVQVYYFQILEDIIKNGFIHNGEKYIYFSSSAGQIRTKKAVFIRESLWEKHKNSLTCGLSVEEINQKGGVNVNKYQAYLALTNSATEVWKGFDINKAIVVDDLETLVHSEVDYIDRDTYEITPRKMDIPITHTDGCGMILPKKSKKSFMVRLPWIKGLLVPFPFDKFAKEHNSFVVKDIYGKEWDIIKDDIQVIFTKSQFKMWKYYDSWQEYKDKFIKYNCQAAKLNEEDTSGEAKLNYQMLQTLTDISDEELKKIAESTIQDILNVGSDKETMLRVLGATKENKKKNWFQEALLIYPELLNDPHSRQVIKDKKRKLVKEARAGKLNVNGKYTFLCPDLYAFCERLFLGKENPKGLLANGEVYCKLFEEGKVDVLRSPHLYREHAIRNNVIDDEKKKWFITEGIYTSIHDPISKMLQFDNDGDKALVIQDETLIKVAERNMQGIVPLYYEMAKAGAEEINPENIYKSLILAYKANIGVISNDITKIWNSEKVDLKVIKWLTMYNNFVIDYAKTLFMPEPPEHAEKKLKAYAKSKVPYFFIYAKDKDGKNVEPINNSTVNRLHEIIPNKRVNFTKVAGKFDYRMLMKNKRVKLDEEIINTYEKLDKHKKWKMNDKEDTEAHETLYIYKHIRDELLKINSDEYYVTDVLVKYLYRKKNSVHKTTLWECFGDIIVKNLERNLKNTKQCEECGERIERKKAKKYCAKCATKRERERVKRLRREKSERK
ncbi:hypothetical protein [Parageobacillus sp. G301]|uniref:RNA dependent RNA polymerase n=1 Tax=Parageobacillus sp. G301 TaxID=2998290 RepID=UPI00249845AE|nr:hypothetical protein [Parageobacillus sp. G301]GLH62387.1 hypothetical protein PG301_02270 [Parageobacillus sp. G301]